MTATIITWAEHLLHFYTTLQPPFSLPNKIQWLYPQRNVEVLALMETFFTRFYNDPNPRTILLGINPGRFGSGITGVNFTAPKQLSQFCGIDHPFAATTELSAEFIYDVITAYGGVEKFYADFFIGAVCPLGFVQHGKNINYYDDKELLKAVGPFIIKNLKKLLAFHVNRAKCICIGGEKNYHYLSSLNEKENFFKEIIPVPHPRFIMQYRRKQKEEYVCQYLAALKK
ncbi:MAG TPA: uracil-DNA glycosylase family protein [Chitinophagaceae bacterium]|jgi:hypothetical protein|nr:uracil-DNA glycosylase family protein [Chitinophagaceae bacterium]